MLGRHTAVYCCGVHTGQQSTAVEAPLLMEANCSGVQPTSAPQLYTSADLRPPRRVENASAID
eukprot:11111022-Lingulodinium_polyedra.AAC.1